MTLNKKQNTSIEVKIDKIKETVSYSTFIEVGGHCLSLSITKYLSYSKPEDLDNPKFEHIFYWPLDFYINPNKNHHVYHRLKETDYYYEPNKSYEVHWKIIEAKLDFNNKNKLDFVEIHNNLEDNRINLMLGKKIVSKPTRNIEYSVAIPPSSEKRTDYITHDFHYKYDVSDNEQYCGIKIDVCEFDNKIEFMAYK